MLARLKTDLPRAAASRRTWRLRRRFRGCGLFVAGAGGSMFVCCFGRGVRLTPPIERGRRRVFVFVFVLAVGGERAPMSLFVGG